MNIQFIKLRKYTPKAKICTKCGEVKPIEEYRKGHNQCKVCGYKQTQDGVIKNRERFIDKCISEGLIKADDRYSAELLLMSCISRFNDCNHNRSSKYYGRVKCDYSSSKHFFKVCLGINGFFSRWHELSEIYRHSKDDNDRPNIDRIDPLLHYTVDNIRPMTKALNAFLAKAEPIIFVLHEQTKLKRVVKDMFDSKADLIRYIEQHYPTVNASNLITKALQAVGEREGEHTEFDYSDKKYYVQAMHIDKLSDYYQARIERMVVQHIERGKAQINATEAF